MAGFFYGLAGFLFLNSVGMLAVGAYYKGASDGEVKVLGQMAVVLMIVATFMFASTIFGDWMGGEAC